MKELDNSLKIHRFDESEIEDIELPKLFTFPFYYTPHPICVIASEQLQREFLMRGFSGHNFGLDPNEQESVIGKMFGVLVVYDEEGQLLTASFMDYTMPRADMVPNFKFETRNVPSTTNAMGIKGAGEAGTIGATPAVMNAIIDALYRAYGIEHIDMPATPNAVWEAIQAAQN